MWLLRIEGEIRSFTTFGMPREALWAQDDVGEFGVFARSGLKIFPLQET